MKLRRIALAVSTAFLVASIPNLAHAEEGGPQDTKAKIKAKMEKILKLMKANEKALLALSSNKDAKTVRVGVDVPPPEGASGNAGTDGSEGSSASGEITKKLEELLKAQKSSGEIPGEMKKLVEMIPT